VVEVRERLTVGKQTTHKFRMERLSLMKLLKVEGKGQYHVEISNKFPTFENIDAEVGINRAWEIISTFQPNEVILFF
jgi:hypothetical protein